MPGGIFFEIWPLEKGRTLTSHPCGVQSKLGAKAFSRMPGGGPSSFSRLISGGNRSSRVDRERGRMRRGQDSPADKSLKRPGREPRHERKGLSTQRWRLFHPENGIFRAELCTDGTTSAEEFIDHGLAIFQKHGGTTQFIDTEMMAFAFLEIHIKWPG